MTTSIQHRTVSSVPLQRLSSALSDVINSLRGFAQKIAAWFEMRERTAADRDTLARMNDRELHDIGLDRGTLTSVADGAWRRDYPY